MRKSARAGILASAMAAALAAPAELRSEQSLALGAPPGDIISVPANVKASGLPPIPSSLPETLLPYGSSRRALLLGWHPVRREMLIWTRL